MQIQDYIKNFYPELMNITLTGDSLFAEVEIFTKERNVITNIDDDRGITKIPTGRALVLIGNEEYLPGTIVYFRSHVDITTKINISPDPKRERFVDNPNTRVITFKKKYLGEYDPGVCVELHEGDIQAVSHDSDFIYSDKVRKFFEG